MQRTRVQALQRKKFQNLFGSPSLLQYWFYCILNSFSSVFKVLNGSSNRASTSVLRRHFHHQDSVTVPNNASECTGFASV